MKAYPWHIAATITVLLMSAGRDSRAEPPAPNGKSAEHGAQTGSEPEQPVTSVSELARRVEALRLTDPSRYAAVRDEAERIEHRRSVAIWGLTLGAVGGGALAAIGNSLMDQNESECDKMPGSSVADLQAKADCHSDTATIGTPWVAAGGLALIGGLVTYLVADPSEREIQAAWQRGSSQPAPETVRVSVRIEPGRDGACASVVGVF
jgi:hypothetical protein